MKTTFENAPKRVGSSEIRVNVSRGGRPFGALWTWPNTRYEIHPWHAKALDGAHRTFSKKSAAKKYMEATRSSARFSSIIRLSREGYI